MVKPCEGSIDSRERLIPWVQGQYVKQVDLEAETIEVDWDPEF
jgi:16S rRNA processing protein RimM